MQLINFRTTHKNRKPLYTQTTSKRNMNFHSRDAPKPKTRSSVYKQPLHHKRCHNKQTEIHKLSSNTLREIPTSRAKRKEKKFHPRPSTMDLIRFPPHLYRALQTTTHPTNIRSKKGKQNKEEGRIKLKILNNGDNFKITIYKLNRKE